MPTVAPRALQRHVQQLLPGRIIRRKLSEGQTIAHLALRRLQEFGVDGRERTIERFARSQPARSLQRFIRFSFPCALVIEKTREKSRWISDCRRPPA
jgi:hypothetical protein